MDSKPSSQIASTDGVIQKLSETSRLLMLSSEVLIMILKFLDERTLVLISPRVCKRFYNHCGLHSNGPLHSNGYMGHLYEFFTFSRGGPIYQPTSDDSWQRRYFQSNVTFLLEGLTQPTELRISIFMRSESREICLSEIVSMAVELSISDEVSIDDYKKAHIRALEFLDKLFDHLKDHLENLKLSGFPVTERLWTLLSKLKLNWFHLKYSLLEWFEYDMTSFSGFKKLHLKAQRNPKCRNYFPNLPASLEELSLHILDTDRCCQLSKVLNCKTLRKM